MDANREHVEEFIRANFKKGFNPNQYAFKIRIDDEFGDADDEVDSITKDMFKRKDGMCFFLDQVVPSGTEPLLNEINSILDRFGCFETTAMFEHVQCMLNRNFVLKVEHFEEFINFIYPGLRTFSFRAHRLMTLSQEDTNTILADMIVEVSRTVHDDYRGSMGPLNVQTEFFAFSNKSMFEILKAFSNLRLSNREEGLTIEEFDSDEFPENLSEVVNNAIARIRDAELETNLDIICIAISLSLGYNFRKRHNLDRPSNKSAVKKIILNNYNGEPPMEWHYDILRPKED